MVSTSVDEVSKSAVDHSSLNGRSTWDKPCEVEEFGNVMDVDTWPRLSDSYKSSTEPSSSSFRSSPFVYQNDSKVNSNETSSSVSVEKQSNQGSNSHRPIQGTYPRPTHGHPTQGSHPLRPIDDRIINSHTHSHHRPTHGYHINSQPPAQGGMYPHPCSTQVPYPHPSQRPIHSFHPHLDPQLTFHPMQPTFPSNAPPFTMARRPHELGFGRPMEPQFIPPSPHVSPFGTPMVFPPDEVEGLCTKIVDQINYYFSLENLIKDLYLRNHMDKDQGWVPVELVAGFRRIALLTHNIPLILYALQRSTVVEVQGNKIRTRENWRRWIIPTDFKLPTMNGRRPN